MEQRRIANPLEGNFRVGSIPTSSVQFHRDDSMKKWTDYFAPEELEEVENMELPGDLDDPVAHWWGMA